MEPIDDWEGEEPEDPIYSDQSKEEESPKVCLRPQVYSSNDLFSLLTREIHNRITSVFPAASLSETLAMLLQRNFQFERIL
ncbi:unnamed protein product [Sphagnum balticum]